MQESTGSVPLAADADAAAIIQAIYDAAAEYFGVTGELPSWIAMGPLGWARLGGLTDAAGRPLFPTLGASNAPGYELGDVVQRDGCRVATRRHAGDYRRDVLGWRVGRARGLHLPVSGARGRRAVRTRAASRRRRVDCRVPADAVRERDDSRRRRVNDRRRRTPVRRRARGVLLGFGSAGAARPAYRVVDAGDGFRRRRRNHGHGSR